MSGKVEKGFAFQILGYSFRLSNWSSGSAHCQNRFSFCLTHSWTAWGPLEGRQVEGGWFLGLFGFRPVVIRQMAQTQLAACEWVCLDELYKMVASVFPLGARETRNQKMAVFWIMAFWVKCAQKCLWSVRPPASDFRFGIYAKFWSRWNYWASASRCRIEEFVIWSWAKTR